MTFKLARSSIKNRLYKSLKAVRTKRSGIVVITAIRSASLSSKCGDSITRNTDEEKSHEGSSELEGGASTMILLPFHPVILTAVAVFLINMLILHGHRHQIMNGMLYPRAFPRNRLDGTAFDVVQGVSSLQARVIRNTFDQGSMATCKVDSSPFICPSSIFFLRN